jgi:hypothetical protein
MPITIGAKRRWAVLIIVNESSRSQFPVGAGRGVWGEGVAFEPPCPTQSRRDLPTVARSCVILLVAALAPHRFAVEFDAVSVVHQAVENRIGDRRIADLRVPGCDRELAGE